LSFLCVPRSPDRRRCALAPVGKFHTGKKLFGADFFSFLRKRVVVGAHFRGSSSEAADSGPTQRVQDQAHSIALDSSWTLRLARKLAHGEVKRMICHRKEASSAYYRSCLRLCEVLIAVVCDSAKFFCAKWMTGWHVPKLHSGAAFLRYCVKGTQALRQKSYYKPKLAILHVVKFSFQRCRAVRHDCTNIFKHGVTLKRCSDGLPVRRNCTLLLAISAAPRLEVENDRKCIEQYID